MADLQMKTMLDRRGKLAQLQFAIHTILWGRDPADFLAILDYIKHSGFQGVELFQDPNYLRRQFGSPSNFIAALNERGLTFVGMCSGTLQHRVEFCEEAEAKPVFLYVDELDPFIHEAIAKGYTVAFHPHAYKQTDAGGTFEQVEKIPNLKFVLDPAHLMVMNQDPLVWLRHAAGLVDVDESSKLAGIHLKDWGAWYGRAFLTYAQGFVELGEGDVPLKEFLEELIDLQKPLWAVVEQDHVTASETDSVQASIDWLNQLCPEAGLKRHFANTTQIAASDPLPLDLTPEAEKVLHKILKSQETPAMFAANVVDYFQDWLRCPVVSLWEHTPAIQRLTLLATSPRGIPVNPLHVNDSLSGLAIQSKTPEFIPDILQVPGRRFSKPVIARQYGLKSLYTLPIWNSHNPNDVEAVLNLYFSKEALEDCLPIQELHRCPPGCPPRIYIDRLMSTIGKYIAQSFERIVADRVTKAVHGIQRLSGQPLGQQQFLEGCLKVISQSIGASAGSIFLEAQHRDRLTLAATTGIRWISPRHYYGRDDGNVGMVWHRDLEHVLDAGANRQPISEEIVERESTDECLAYVPIRMAGNCVGVIRCRNKPSRESTSSASVFTQSDITVLQAIGDAMASRLQLFAAQRANLIRLRKMAHELKSPLTGINAQLDFIDHELGSAKLKLTHAWTEQARNNTSLMDRLICNAQTIIQNLAPSGDALPEPFDKHFVYSEIVAPVRDQMRALLARKRYSDSALNVNRRRQRAMGADLEVAVDWSIIPKLFLRLTAIQQVLFNVLSNAIKYCYKDPKSLRIEVYPDTDSKYYAIRVRDFGIGIETGEEERIFESEFRGKNAARYDVYGQGLGLSISKDIMLEHGGDLRLTNPRLPTEFSLLFPKSLQSKPPTVLR